MTTPRFSLLILIYLVLLSSCKNIKQNLQQVSNHSSKWIDLDESENYTARHECSFVQAGDKFILFGGRESAQKLDIYDYQNNTWHTSKKLAPKEFNHFQATFFKGFVWVIGAFKTNNFPKEIPEEHIWLYHLPTDTWIEGPEIPENRRRGGAGLVVYKDKFYLVGGNTMGHNGGYVNWFDAYDPKKNSWTVLENASQQRDHFSAAIINNTLFAIGGRQSGGPQGVFAPLIDRVDTYNFETKTWKTLASVLPTPRAAPSVAVFNNEILVMGGEGETRKAAYKIVEAYNPETKTWSQKPDMHYPRHGTQAITSENSIYITAGSPTRGGGRQLNMEAYNETSVIGNPITVSNFETPKSVSINSDKSKKITIKNTGGNSASFINSLKLTGTHAENFKITNTINLTLIDAESKFTIEVKHINSIANETANLKIIYNGNSISTIKLISN